MKLTQFLSADFFVSEQMSKELSHIESQAYEDFDYKNEYGASDTASNYKKIIELQKKTAEKKGIRP